MAAAAFGSAPPPLNWRVRAWSMRARTSSAAAGSVMRRSARAERRRSSTEALLVEQGPEPGVGGFPGLGGQRPLHGGFVWSGQDALDHRGGSLLGETRNPRR